MGLRIKLLNAKAKNKTELCDRCFDHSASAHSMFVFYFLFVTKLD